MSKPKSKNVAGASSSSNIEMVQVDSDPALIKSQRNVAFEEIDEESQSQVVSGVAQTAYVADDYDYDDSDDLTNCECARLILAIIATMVLIIAGLVCLLSKKPPI
jgi:hypothetical protein